MALESVGKGSAVGAGSEGAAVNGAGTRLTLDIADKARGGGQGRVEPARHEAKAAVQLLTEEQKAKMEADKKKAEEVKARRAAALSVLLEPPSPGTFASISSMDGVSSKLSPSAKNASDDGDGLGGLAGLKFKNPGDPLHLSASPCGPSMSSLTATHCVMVAMLCGLLCLQCHSC